MGVSRDDDKMFLFQMETNGASHNISLATGEGNEGIPYRTGGDLVTVGHSTAVLQTRGDLFNYLSRSQCIEMAKALALCASRMEDEG